MRKFELNIRNGFGFGTNNIIHGNTLEEAVIAHRKSVHVSTHQDFTYKFDKGNPDWLITETYQMSDNPNDISHMRVREIVGK